MSELDDKGPQSIGVLVRQIVDDVIIDRDLQALISSSPPKQPPNTEAAITIILSARTK